MIQRRDCLYLAGGLVARSAWAQSAPARVALVIGNAAYARAPLLNAANDAKAMSTVLRAMGFEVIELRDAGKARMEEGIALSRAMLQGRGGVGLLYYAGHGLQVDWRNYMVPLDARCESAADVPGQAVDIQAAIDAFRAAGNRMNIVVLDACRDNPFGTTANTIATGKGLAPLDAPSGTYLAYATAPGNVAEDGSSADGNGLYTRFLIKEMQRPDARIEEVFKRVRLQVRQASQGRQVPWESTSLEEEFIFATGQVAPRENESERRRDTAFEGEMAAWDRIKDSRSADDFYTFLSRYPNGRISELAQFRLDQLSRPAVQATGPAGLRMLPSGADRYAKGDAWVVQREDRRTGDKRTVRFQVTDLEGSRVIVNRGVVILDQMGGVIKNFTGFKTPAVMTAPADVQLGKRWRSSFRNQTDQGTLSTNHYDYLVAALEVIEVPAGRFRVFRIEGKGESISPNSMQRLSTTTWIDPETMLSVRNDIRQSSRNGAEVHVDRTDALASRTLVPRA